MPNDSNCMNPTLQHLWSTAAARLTCPVLCSLPRKVDATSACAPCGYTKQRTAVTTALMPVRKVDTECTPAACGT
jgi:hypothetical protein